MNHCALRKPPGLPTALLLLLLLCGNPHVVSVFACVCMATFVNQLSREAEGACVVSVHYLCMCIWERKKGDKVEETARGKDKLWDWERRMRREFVSFPASLAASSPLLTRAFCCGSNYMRPRAEGVSSLSDLVDGHLSTYSWNRTSAPAWCGRLESRYMEELGQKLFYGCYVVLVNQGKVYSRQQALDAR